jgi:methyl-galactoside transport system substrate-binding protein
MKNNVCKTLMLLPLVGICACSTPSRVAQLFIYDSTDTFISSLRVDLCNRLDGYISYNVNKAERKQTTQNEQMIEALNDSRTKILVMNTVDRLASSALIEKAENKNVPIVFFNREPLPDDFAGAWAQKNCYYVGSDPSVEGTLQAKIADQIFGGKDAFSTSVYDKNKDGIVQVAILKGEQGHQDAEQRSQYCVSELKALGYSVEITTTAYCNWERSVAKETMKTLYNSSIELLFCNNDDMALGAIDYLNSGTAGKTTSSSVSSSFSSTLNSSSAEASSSISSSGSSLPFDQRYFPIIGVDDTAAGQEAIEAGYLAGTVLNNADKQATVIFDLIKHILDGADIPSYSLEEVVPNGNFYHVLGQIVRKK